MKQLLFDFIQKIGRKQEVELFLQVYKTISRIQFGVIDCDEQVLHHQTETLAEQLALMGKLGIFPILAFTLDDPKTFDATCDAFIQTLKSRGSKAERVNLVFEYCGPGDIRFDLKRLGKLLQRGILPIISPTGLYRKGSKTLSGHRLSQALVKTLLPKKYILLTPSGGILDEQDSPIPFLNLSQNKTWALAKVEMQKQVKAIRDFLRQVDDCAVVITSAENLLKEIFTIKGSGTFIKYHEILTTYRMKKLDHDKIKALLENAFDKTLVDTYFDQRFRQIYYEKDYEGIAILQTLNGIPYLDKFAVAKVVEGTGLGKSLWQKMIKSCPKLIWRATRVNPMNSFYMRECDGFMKYEDWYVFWRGLGEKEIFPCLHRMLKKPRTLV
ncbi:MAG: hypothetical protein AB7F28_00970 [Candidatus Margulisiibacteriota bacterium]